MQKKQKQNNNSKPVNKKRLIKVFARFFAMLIRTEVGNEQNNVTRKKKIAREKHDRTAK